MTHRIRTSNAQQQSEHEVLHAPGLVYKNEVVLIIRGRGGVTDRQTERPIEFMRKRTTSITGRTSFFF